MSLLASAPFTPEPYADILDAFPPGAMPEAAYAKMLARFVAVTDARLSRIVYASEGLRVTGLMATPAEIAPGAHPIVVYNRGGSGEYGRLTLYTALQMLIPLAQAGYLVFASNYRGNAGGEGREEFGGADVADVLALLAIARAQPGWDGSNAYMVGHSRGGMMTALNLKAGAEVNAAVSIAGFLDVAEAWRREPDMRERVFARYIPQEERESEEAYIHRSALYWPEKIGAPLLLLHGDADDVVNVSHSIRMAERLENLGKSHKLMVYPGGNHALTRHWPDVLDEIKQWLEQYRHKM